MFENMEKLKIEGVIRAPSSLHRRYENRSSHALILKVGGGTRYFFPDRSFVLEEGQVLWIPRGSSYTVQRREPTESEYCLINFQAELPDPGPVLVNLPPWLEGAEVCRRLTALRVLTTTADRYRLTALFYQLLSCLCQEQSHPDRERSRLTPALEYMQEKMFDPDLRVEQLHRLCGISDTYFRTLFREHFGMNPKQYILSRRLSHAKGLLDNGEYDSIAQAAHLSGFEDPLYFSKAFKSRYGHPPSR